MKDGGRAEAAQSEVHGWYMLGTSHVIGRGLGGESQVHAWYMRGISQVRVTPVRCFSGELARTFFAEPGRPYSVTLTQRWAFISNRGREPAGTRTTGTRRLSAVWNDCSSRRGRAAPARRVDLG